MTVSEASLTMGRKKMEKAEEMFAGCLEADQWPAYPLDTLQSSPTEWGERRWLERESAEEAEPPRRGKSLTSTMGG